MSGLVFLQGVYHDDEHETQQMQQESAQQQRPTTERPRLQRPSSGSGRELFVAGTTPTSGTPRVVADGSGSVRERLRSRLERVVKAQELYLYIFSFLVGTSTLHDAAAVCVKWHVLTSRRSLFRSMHMFNDNDNGVNWFNFQRLEHAEPMPSSPHVVPHGVHRTSLGHIQEGTEGVCTKVFCRSSGTVFAMKKARVFPQGEGVAYYVLRELAVLQGMSHPHINSMTDINLNNNQLHIFFPYVQRSLQDILTLQTLRPLSDFQCRRLLYQLLLAVSYCHHRGVCHRNIKPKHLLIEVPPLVPSPGLASPKNDGSIGDLDRCVLKLADFALTRDIGVRVCPREPMTPKVVTLWYRAPEILMGQQYTATATAVDMFSVGCVLAEIWNGRPFFTGSSEIDQLFQVFSTLGMPTAEAWPEFKTSPHYGPAFECLKFEPIPISKYLPRLDPACQSLFFGLVAYDPKRRLSAEQALRSCAFDITYPHKQGQGQGREQKQKQKQEQKEHCEYTDLDLGCAEFRKLSLVEDRKDRGVHSNWAPRGSAVTLSAPPSARNSQASHTSSSNSSSSGGSSGGSGSGSGANAVDRAQALRHRRQYLLELESSWPGVGCYLPPAGMPGAGTGTEESGAGAGARAGAGAGVADTILPLHRAMVVDWIVELVDVFDMHNRTAYLAIAHLDRILALSVRGRHPPVDRADLQLVGATALHIASKCEDTAYISANDLAMCADHLYTANELLAREETILRDLGFRLSVPIVYDFLMLWLSLMDAHGQAVPAQTRWLAEYISELALLSYELLRHAPSAIAACALSLALHCTGSCHWPPALQHASRLEWQALAACMHEMQGVYSRAPSSALEVIRQRYMKPERGCVAQLPPPLVYDMAD